MNLFLAFSLGVFIVLAIAGVVNMFKVWQKVKQHDTFETDVNHWIQSVERNYEQECNDIRITHQHNIDEIYRTIDSRLDKMESRIRQYLDQQK